MSRKTIFTLPVTTFEEAFLATIPLPPGPLPRKYNNHSDRHRKNRYSRWEKAEYSSVYPPHVNGHDPYNNIGLSKAEYLDMFRPPTPLETDESSSKLSIPEVIVTQGDRKGSFEDVEFSMYYELNPDSSYRINSKNLVVPSMVAYPNNYIPSPALNSAEPFLSCSRLAKEADAVQKWISVFENDSSTDGLSVEVTKSEISVPRVNGDNNTYHQVDDAITAQNWYQSNGISETTDQVETNVNGAWVSPNSSKVKLGKFKFLRNEHCSELVANRVNEVVHSDSCLSTKLTEAGESECSIAPSDVEDQLQTFTSTISEAEENKEQNESAGNQKTPNRRKKGSNSGSCKFEHQGERRRSSRIKSMEEKREREREKLRENKDPADDNATANVSEPATAETSPQSPLSPPFTPSDGREESSAFSHQEEKQGESISKLDNEFAVPASPWNGGYTRTNHKETVAENDNGRQTNIGPVKVKSRWRRCSELESVFSGSRGEIIQSSNLNSSSPNSSDFYKCTPSPPPSSLPLGVSEMFRTPPPPPPPSVGFFSPGEITEDWSEQEVTTSLTKNPLPLKLRPTSPVVSSQTDIKAMTPPPPPKEKPAYLTYEEIAENIYLSSRMRSKARKEVRRMVCDCTLTKEEITRGCLGCGDDCLNRLLMMECGSRCNTADRCSNRKFQNKEYANVEPFKTDKKGWGLRALEDLDGGLFVMEYIGEVLDQREFKKRVKEYAADKQRHHYFMALKADQIIDATQKGSWSRFINHSCDPNCETQKWTVSGELRIGFFTRRLVKAGEEITFDYQFQRYGKEAQRCFCEASNCRGFIGEEKQTPLKKDKDRKDKKKRNWEERRREFGEDMDHVIERLNKIFGYQFIHLMCHYGLYQPTVSLVIVFVPPTSATRLNLTLILKSAVNRNGESKIKGRYELKLKVHCHVDLIGKLQEELEKFSQLQGLSNRYQTLNLCRLMVRADDAESRTILMHCLQRTEEVACLRLFLDYHGLSLIWSWMMDIGNSETSTTIKIEVLKTLSKLPLTSRNSVMESKLMPVIQKWTSQIMEAEPPMKKLKLENEEDANENKEIKAEEYIVNEKTSCVEVKDDSEHGASVETTDTNEENVCEKDHEEAEAAESLRSSSDTDENSTDVQMTVVDEVGTTEDGNSCDSETKIETDLADSISQLSAESADANSSDAILMDITTINESVKKKSDFSNVGEDLGKDESSSKDGEKICKEIDEPSKDGEEELQNDEHHGDGDEVNKESIEPAKISNEEAGSIVNSQESVVDDDSKETTNDESNSVFSLATKLLGSWSELKQLYRIPKREQAQNRHDHEREAEGSTDDDEEEDDYKDQDGDRNTKDKNESDYNQHDRRRRDRYRDRDRDRGRRDHYKKRRSYLNSHPRISKEERRQLFEQKVHEEQEALRWQQEEYYRQQQEAQAQMEMYYNANYAGIPGHTIAYYDPASGYTIPAIAAPVTADPVVDSTPTATPDINAPVMPAVGTIIPTVIPQVVHIDPTVSSPIAVVPVPVEGPAPPPAFDTASSISTPTPVPAPVVYPIYPSATSNNTSTGFSPVASFVTPQGQPIYYPPHQGVVVHLPPDQSAWPHIIPGPVEAPPPPEPPKPVKLPPNWKTAKDEEGNTYYYHTVTRQTQWDPPPCEESDALEEPVPEESPKNKKNAVNDSSGEYSRRIKESFRSKMSQFIVQYLNPYRKPDCKQGRISSTEEFKHLARKLTHFVMAKELKYCKNVEDLECNENVKHKAKDFVRKYMSKFGAIYKKTASPKEDDE